MRRNILAVAIAAMVIAMWPGSGVPATLPLEAARSSGTDLTDLTMLNTTLKQQAAGGAHALESGCEFEGVRDRLLQVREEAIAAVRRLGGLWRDGRLRHGGFALAEVLVYEFAGLVNELTWTIAAADTLAQLQAQSRQAADSADLLARIAAIHPPATACVAAGLELTQAGTALAR